MYIFTQAHTPWVQLSLSHACLRICIAAGGDKWQLSFDYIARRFFSLHFFIFFFLYLILLSATAAACGLDCY